MSDIRKTKLCLLMLFFFIFHIDILDAQDEIYGDECIYKTFDLKNRLKQFATQYKLLSEANEKLSLALKIKDLEGQIGDLENSGSEECRNNINNIFINSEKSDFDSKKFLDEIKTELEELLNEKFKNKGDFDNPNQVVDQEALNKLEGKLDNLANEFKDHKSMYLNQVKEMIYAYEGKFENALIGTWGLIIATVTLFIAPILAFIGAIFGGYRYLKRRIDEIIHDRVQIKLHSKDALIQANMGIHNGYINFRSYFVTDELSQLASAIYQTEWALKRFDDVVYSDLSDEDKLDFNWLSMQMKSNLIYYFATIYNDFNDIADSGDYDSNYDTDKTLAVKFITEVFHDIKYPQKFDESVWIERNADWQESCCFGMYFFGDIEEKNNACKIMIKLLNDINTPQQFKDSNRDEWSKRCNKSTNKLEPSTTDIDEED